MVLLLPGIQQAASHSGWAESYPYSYVIGAADPAAWHHYTVIWNTNGIESVTGNPAVAVLFDDKIILSRPVSAVNFTSHVNGMQSVRYLSLTINAYNRGRSPYSIDEFKVWDTDNPTEPGTIPKTPILKPESGTTFDASLTVSMTCASEGATIHYTTDGTTPTMESAAYKSKFKIYGMTTVKAIAFYEDGTPSEMAVAVYAKGHCSMPVITAQSQFTGSKAKVTLACDTEDAIIRYTTNGADPNSHSTKYKGPFYVTDTTTVKAYATKADYTNSDIAALTITKVWGIGDTMGKPDHTFETSGAKGFVRVEDKTATLGESMKSGAITDYEKSILSTKVIGPGTLTFKWKASCEEDDEYEWDHGEFRVNGELKGRINGVTDWIEVSQRIDSEGTNTVTWTYVKDDVESVGQDCIWVSEYKWASDYTETQTTDVPVPYEWLKEKSRDIVDEYENYEKVAKQKAYNPKFTVEQCYVAGLDPESTTNDFKTAIKMVDGVPVIEWDPDLGIQREYKIWGRESLVGGSWQCPTNSTHHFFKVTVEMPE